MHIFSHRSILNTGMHLVHIDDPGHTFRDSPEVASILRPVMDSHDLIAHRLGEIGWTLGDVTHVVNTHLHFDHCGQNAAFTDVPILVHREHFAAALNDDAFPNEYFDLPLDYELFEGDRVELFPGVTTITTHGHAPYHQSLLIELPHTGPVLLAVDAIYVRDNLTHGAWGSQQDPEAAAAGAALLTALAEERGALLVYGHDPEQWETLARSYD